MQLAIPLTNHEPVHRCISASSDLHGLIKILGLWQSHKISATFFKYRYTPVCLAKGNWTDWWFISNSFGIMSHLTHWGRVTHICASKLSIIVSDNGLSLGRHQAIIWTNDGMLFIGSLKKLQWNLNRNLYSFTQEDQVENIVWKMAALSRPQCVYWQDTHIHPFAINWWISLQIECRLCQVFMLQLLTSLCVTGTLMISYNYVQFSTHIYGYVKTCRYVSWQAVDT